MQTNQTHANMQHYLNFYGLLFGAWFLSYIIYTIYWYTQYVQLAIKSGYLYSLLIFYWLMFNNWSKQMSNLITLVPYEDHNLFFSCSWLIDITSVRGISYSYLSRKSNVFNQQILPSKYVISYKRVFTYPVTVL